MFWATGSTMGLHAKNSQLIRVLCVLCGDITAKSECNDLSRSVARNIVQGTVGRAPIGNTLQLSDKRRRCKKIGELEASIAGITDLFKSLEGMVVRSPELTSSQQRAAIEGYDSALETLRFASSKPANLKWTGSTEICVTRR